MSFRSDDITPALVERLVAAQFPQWVGLPITPAEPQGWDNRTFRLGAELSVRLPSAAGYTPQVEKEHCWLPHLAPRLPLPIPASLAKGAPGEGYPFPWSVRRWLPGETAQVGRIADLASFAKALAAFLTALQQVEPAGGPPPGPHSAFRGAPLATYDAETQRALVAVQDLIDAEAASRLWHAALATPSHGSPVWFHGDVAATNLLIRDGQLSAVLDFGCCGVGDPACDVVIAWTLFGGESRTAFRAALPLDEGTWARGRGWALWKALITLAEYRATDTTKATEARRVIAELLAEESSRRA